MKKLSILITFILLACQTLMGANISKEDASVVCQNFLRQKQANGQTNESFTYYKTVSFNQTPVYHLFKFNKIGFVAISASDNFTPILCYSFESDYMPNAGFEFAMDIYSRWISYCEKNEVRFDADVEAQWQQYLSPQFDATPTRAPVVPELLRSRWNQDQYFNTYCPWDIQASYGCDGRVYTGCVSTAMAQVMNYYGHPFVGVGGSSYVPEPYGRYTVRFFQQQYNYDAMPNVPTSYANEMAKLIHHCGVAVQMGYTVSGSGAQSIHAITAMKNHFKYNDGVLVYRGSFNEGVLSFTNPNGF